MLPKIGENVWNNQTSTMAKHCKNVVDINFKNFFTVNINYVTNISIFFPLKNKNDILVVR